MILKRCACAEAVQSKHPWLEVYIAFLFEGVFCLILKKNHITDLMKAQFHTKFDRSLEQVSVFLSLYVWKIRIFQMRDTGMREPGFSYLGLVYVGQLGSNISCSRIRKTGNIPNLKHGETTRMVH